MADEASRPELERAMSLIPYAPDQSREIILRHESTVVVYDRRSHQLSLRDASNSRDLVISECPTCHRPYHEDVQHHRASSDSQSGEDQGTQSQYMNPSYFRMLNQSTPSTPRSSGPPSPPRRVIQPVATPLTPQRPLQAPPGTEFVTSEPTASHGISSNAFSPNYFKTFFVEERELGRGGKGVVLLVRHVLDGVSLGQFACKRVPVGDDHAWLEKVLVEVQLLQNLSHQNLVSYRHVWLEDYQINPFQASVPCAFILQQYCNAGDLHHYVLDPARVSPTKEQLKERMRKRSKGELEPPVDLHEPRRMQFEEIFSFFKDITSGLHHLHANGYIHRDLKPSNCLLHQTGQRFRVMVSDFGEVQVQNVVRKSTGATGTISYCAPEVLRRETPDGAFGNFTTKSDVFSLGMIVYFMCFARLPYRHADEMHEEMEDMDRLRAEIAAWVGFDDATPARKDLPDKLYKFLKRLLSLDPNDRPSTDEILLGIRRESGLDDLDTSPHPSILDNLRNKSRISSIDSPSPTPRRRHSGTKLSDLASPTSVRRQPSHLRPPSPEKHFSTSRSEKTSSEQKNIPAHSTAMIKSSSHQTFRSASFEDAPASPTLGRRSPERLALPPPPQPPPSVLESFAAQTSMSGILKILFFLVKYMSITQPCAPYISNRWLTYPILLLAMVDFLPLRMTLITGQHVDDERRVEVEIGWRRSVILFIFHFLLVGSAFKFNLLCESPFRVWEPS